MPLYIHYNAEDNSFIGFYDSRATKKLPSPVVEIESEQQNAIYEAVCNYKDVHVGDVIIKPMRPVELLHPLTWDDIRQKRNGLLKSSDWVMLPDVPKGTSDKYLEYRQTLRDITEYFDEPQDVIWPELPA